MKLVYRCLNCNAQKEFDMPQSVTLKYGAEDVLNGIDGIKLNMWIRHPCADDLHGIAPLVAIVDN